MCFSPPSGGVFKLLSMSDKIIYLQNQLDINTTFREMGLMDRKLFISYLSDHILHSDEKFEELANLLWKWHNESPTNTKFLYPLDIILHTK
jgi:hypothetical protein